MSDTKSSGAFISGLGKGKNAFLAEVVERAIALGERTPEDFLAHFSSAEIMRALADRPVERAAILCGAARTHEKIAPKMSADASGEALQIALDEEVTTPAEIVSLFKPDDRQTYLDDAKLWEFAVEGDPQNASGAEVERASAFIAFMLERGIENELISDKDLVEALSISKLASTLPHEVLAAIIQGSLASQTKFAHKDLLKVATPTTLARHLPLDLIWENVIVPLLAEKSGYIKGGSTPSKDAVEDEKTETTVEAGTADGVTKGADGPAGAAPKASEPTAKAAVREGQADKAPTGSAAAKASSKLDDVVETADVDVADVSQIDEVEEDELVEGVDSDDGFEEILDEELSEPPPGPGVKQALSADASKNGSSGKGSRKLGLR